MVDLVRLGNLLLDSCLGVCDGEITIDFGDDHKSAHEAFDYLFEIANNVPVKTDELS